MVVIGTGNDDVLTGSASADDINGGAGNDRITGNGGNDVIRGGDGFDNAVFNDVFANYTIKAVSAGKTQSDEYYTITHQGASAGKLGSDGQDTVYLDVEFFDFADRKSIPKAALVNGARADDGQVVTGTEGADGNLTGTSGNDTFSALGGNDLIVGSDGNDIIDGGLGLDAVSYSSYSSTDISLTKANDTISITMGSFTDQLKGVERIRLKDKWLATDFDGQAGAAAKVITAAFGKDLLSTYLSVGIAQADSGQSVKDLCDLVVNSGLMNYSNNTDFVNLIYNNLLSRDANLLESATFVNYLETGLYTQSGLMEMAANTSMATALMTDYAIGSIGLPYDAGLV